MLSNTRSRIRRKWKIFLLAIIMLGITTAFAVPLYALVVISFKTTRDLIYSPLSFPTELNLQNFKNAWQTLNLEVVYKNKSYYYTLCCLCPYSDRFNGLLHIGQTKEPC